MKRPRMRSQVPGPQQQEVLVPVFEHRVKMFRVTDIEGQLEGAVEEYLDDMSLQAWKIGIVNAMPDFVFIIMLRPRQSKIATPKPGILTPRGT